jgi:hypothetical protein
MTSTEPVHSESETHPWSIQVPNHPARSDSPEYVAAREKMNEIAAGATGLVYGSAPFQDHHGGALWLKDDQGWFLVRNLAGVEWSAQFCAEPVKIDLLRQNAKRLYDLLAPEIKQELDPGGLLDTPITDAAGVAKWTDSLFNAGVPLQPTFHIGTLPGGTSTPADDNADDASAPADASSAPADGSGTPAGGSGTPADGSGTPADGTSTPADGGTSTPADGGAAAPADGGAAAPAPGPVREPAGVHHYPTPIVDIQLFKYDDFELWVTDAQGNPAAVAPVSPRGSGDASIHVLYATPGSQLAEQKQAAESANTPLILGPGHSLSQQAYKHQQATATATAAATDTATATATGSAHTPDSP